LLEGVAHGGLAATFDLAAFGLYMIAPVKKWVNHSKTLASMREVQGTRARTTRECLFFVRGFSIVEKEFVFCYCLFAVSIFCDSTAFEYHISLNSESVYTPTVYNVKNMSCDVCVIETNARRVNSHLTSKVRDCRKTPHTHLHLIE